MKEEELFQQALECRADERAAFLRAACGDDEPLRLRVEAILKAHEQPGSFLQSPAIPIPGTEGPAVEPGPQTELWRTGERPDSVIGPYKLLEQIGEGGFGVVFLAEQSQPVRRKVALKILKPGMDTHQVVARFEAERQALAIMDHPNIAKVFDGGTTPSGRPYFVMELVNGVPITEYCDRHHLTPRQRLELFVSICNGVQHAHHKGIIHRDLKPTNVLVSQTDGTPIVKIIDFGVAKALGQELTDKTLFTGLAQMIGTPLYMSPEQAGRSGLDIDTRSDIYSLGVLLYELLTGTTPFTKDRFKKAAYDEICRIIREEEPPKPSTRLSESKDALPSISAQRQTEPRNLTKLLRGDLDWIVMKALEKDRSRRYETANGLAMDVQRNLADEAVLACPPSAGYRLRKFMRRNKGPVLAVNLIVLALIGGIVGATWGLVSAQSARDDEIAQRKKAENESKRAVKAEAETRQKQRQTKATLASMALDRGMSLGEQGDANRASLWLARGLEFAHEAEDPNLQRVLRRNLAAWRHEIHPWRGVFLHGEVVASALFSSDGRTIATASYDHTARLWDVATGKPISPPMQHSDAVVALAFSPDGKLVVTGSADQTARLWSVATGKPVGAPLRHDDKVRGVVFSSDGRTIVTTDGKKTLLEWEIATGRQVEQSSKGMRVVTTVDWVFSKDGSVLLDGQTLWGTAARKPLGRRPPHAGRLMSVALSPDGKTVVTGGHTDLAARHWELATAKPIGSPMPHPDRVMSVAFSPDGMILATGCHDGLARLWDAATGTQLGAPMEHGSDIFSVAFSPDGKSLLTGCADGTARQWYLADRWPETPLTHPAAVLEAAAFSRDAKRLATSATTNGLVRIWDTATGRMTHELDRPGKIMSMTFSPDGCRILTGREHNNHRGSEFAAQLWDAATGTPIGSAMEHQSHVYSVAFGPDGKTLLTGTERAAQLWDANTGKPIGPPLEQRGVASALAFSPDGKTFAAGTWDFRAVTFWDVATRKQIGPPLTQEGHVLAVAFSPDGKTLLTGCGDGAAHLWDVEARKPIGPPLQHAGVVLAVAFSPDGQTILTGSRDKTARLWDAATGKQIGPPMRHMAFVHAVGFSSDGKSAVSVSSNGIVWLDVPQPVLGEVERVTLWAQVTTGMQLTDEGLVHRLTAKAGGQEASWQERVGRLEKLGGIPVSESGTAANETLRSAVHFSIGNAFKAKGNLEACVREYEQGIDIDPNNAEAKWAVLNDYLTLANTGKNGGDALTTKAHLARVDAILEQLTDPLAKRAATFQNSPVRQHEIAAAYAKLGNARKIAGQMEKAEVAYHTYRSITDKLAADYPKQALYRRDQIWIRLELCRLLEDAGRPKETEGLFGVTEALAQRCAADFPAPARAWLSNFHGARGQFYARAGRSREAAADFAAVAKLNLTKSEADFLDSILARPDDVILRNNFADWLLHQDRLTEAEFQIRAALKLNPKSRVAHLTFGEILYAAGKKAEAEVEFGEAVRIGFDLAGTHSAMGHAYAHGGAWDKAAAALTRTVEVSPSDYWARFYRAAYALASNDAAGYRRACAEALKVFGKGPDQYAVYVTVRASVLAPNAVPDAAVPVQMMKKAVNQSPTADMLFTLGMAHYRAGQFNEALTRLNEAVSTGRSWTDATCVTGLALAMVHHQLGHPEEAQKSLDEAIKRMERGAPEKWPSAHFPTHEADWVTCVILRKEAEALMGKGAAAKEQKN